MGLEALTTNAIPQTGHLVSQVIIRPRDNGVDGREGEQLDCRVFAACQDRAAVAKGIEETRTTAAGPENDEARKKGASAQRQNNQEPSLDIGCCDAAEGGSNTVVWSCLPEVGEVGDVIRSSERGRRDDWKAVKGSEIELFGPSLAVKSLLTATEASGSNGNGNVRSQDNVKYRGTPGVSMLRAPGWGLDAVINSILPASDMPGNTKKAKSVPFTATAAVRDSSPSMATFLPGDLLTPVTEAATVEEQSAISSCGTHVPRSRATSVISVASHQNTPGDLAATGEGSRGRYCHPQSPRRNNHKGYSHPLKLMLPAVVHRKNTPKLAGENNGNRIGGQNRHRWQNRALWGDKGGMGSNASAGARSAPDRPPEKSFGTNNPESDILRSSSANRSSPLSSGAGGDRVVARGSSFSSGNIERMKSGGNVGTNGGGYIAAIGRRARSMAKYEAARRLAAVSRATEKARPTTPISERARWGKGRETRTEIERRKLLQRRYEYAKELSRKARVSSELKSHSREKCILRLFGTRRPLTVTVDVFPSTPLVLVFSASSKIEK